MACLAFGRVTLDQQSAGERHALDAAEGRQLAVAEDPRLVVAEAAVFDALARQVRAVRVAGDAGVFLPAPQATGLHRVLWGSLGTPYFPQPTPPSPSTPGDGFHMQS